MSKLSEAKLTLEKAERLINAQEYLLNEYRYMLCRLINEYGDNGVCKVALGEVNLPESSDFTISPNVQNVVIRMGAKIEGLTRPYERLKQQMQELGL